MKKNILTTALLLMPAFMLVRAQDGIPDFGRIDKADLQLTECPFYKNAAAMNLLKTADTKISVDLYSGTPKVTTAYRVRIKIFDEKAFDKASIVIPYYESRSTKITDVEAVIFNIDDKGNAVAQKLTKDQIFKEKSKGKNASGSVRFTFPGLTRGSVIEYQYTRIDKNGIIIKPWFFQDELPCRYSKFNVDFPALIDIQTHIVAAGAVERDSSEKVYAKTIYNEHIRSFTMRNIPPFKIEPMMTSLKDNLQRIEFAVLPQELFILGITNIKVNRWPTYNNMFLRSPYFGAQFTQQVPGTETFVDSISHLADTVAKLESAYEYVKRNISWNGEQIFFSADINECWKEKSGSSAEMNILLLNLLKKAGVTCYPVLISTRDNGHADQEFPSYTQFNGVDVLVVTHKAVYVLDATQKNLPFNITPLNVLNTPAFMVDRQLSQWINITDRRSLMNTELYLNAMMDSAGVMTGGGRLVFTGVAKAEEIRQEQADKKDDSKEMVGNDQSDLKIDSVTSLHRDDDNDTLIENITFHNTVSATGDIYFVNPYLFTMFKKNPFKDTSRTSDIDFGCIQSYTTRLLLLVPENFSVEELPKSISIRMSDSSIVFTREIVSLNRQLMIRNSFIVNRPLFFSDEYNGIKSFFDKVYGLINEQILLKKKG
ncbi:MAG TPA: DUF3857 domain-containing protein [Chitinophagaceae bacterium]|nr:DUF3857 domain-containing protein [Chitinophagaceae bacterium]